MNTIHTSWSYDTNGILVGAMDENDAQRAHSLIEKNVLIDVVSGHDFHFEHPEAFIQIMNDFKNKVQPS